MIIQQIVSIWEQLVALFRHKLPIHTAWVVKEKHDHWGSRFSRCTYGYVGRLWTKYFRSFLFSIIITILICCCGRIIICTWVNGSIWVIAITLIFCIAITIIIRVITCTCEVATATTLIYWISTNFRSPWKDSVISIITVYKKTWCTTSA